MLGISTTYFALQGFGIYDSVREADSMGFGLAELGAAHNFEKNIPQTLKKIRKDFPGMHFTVHGLFPPVKKKFWFNPPEGLTAVNRKVIKGFFSAAGTVGAKLVSFHPGFRNKASWVPSAKAKGLFDAGMGTAIPEEKAFSKAFMVLAFAQKLSEETGIPFAIENMTFGGKENPLFLENSHFEKAFEQFPNCGLLLDLGHALCSGNVTELLLLNKKIKQVHLHYSEKIAGGNMADNHLAIKSLAQLEPLAAIKQLGTIPLIFEHGTNVSGQQLLLEKSLVESFLKENRGVKR